MMPITYIFGSLHINLNEPFYTADVSQMKNNTFLKQDGIKDLGSYTLTNDDLKELRNMLPNFQLKTLRKWMKVKRSRKTYGEELIFYPLTKYESFGQPQYSIANFEASTQNAKKYKEWLNTDNKIFIKPYIRNIPSSLTAGEKLFDKDVIEIKNLVKDIGDVEKLIQNEQLNFILYDNSNVIKETFFTELNKNFSSYGLISINYNYDNKTLINWKNKLEFTIQKNIRKEFLSFQLEEAIEPKKVGTEDLKMTNITILKLDDQFKKQIITSFLIQGLQKFEKYKTLNPLTIQVIDANIRKGIALYARSNYRYKFRFIANSLLFSSAIKGNTKTIFLVANELVDAKYILINSKFFQAIAAIYTSEIENWSQIKKQSHWVNVKLTDAIIPIAAKHFAFGFETQDFNNLLNFEYSLISNKGELIEFEDGETKIPALNFATQIIQ